MVTLLPEAPLKKKIQKGVKLLNKLHPNWHQQVVLNLLDLEQEIPCLKSKFRACVLGQLYGNFWEAGCKRIAHHDPLNFADQATHALNAAAPYGLAFDEKQLDNWQEKDPSQKTMKANYRMLTRLWVKEIKQLRKISKFLARK